MPVVSFSISTSLRKFIKNLIQGGFYKNKSVLMRDALTRMMNAYSETDDVSLGSSNLETKESEFSVTGNIMIVLEKFDDYSNKKLIKVEVNYKDAIRAKTCFFYKNDKTIVYVFEKSLEEFQLFITELNQIENLKNIRYLIL